jgi:hypothetical protein
MKTIKIVWVVTIFLSSLLSNSQDFDSADPDHWKYLIENTTYDDIKEFMTSLEYALQEETAEGAKEVLTFSNKSDHKIKMIYINKKLSKVGSLIFIMSLPLFYTELEENAYTIIAKEKVKMNGKKEEARTWGKANSRYKFTTISGGVFFTLLQIDILDDSKITHVSAEPFPSVQKYLDKIEGKIFEENSSVDKMISQRLSVNTHTKNSITISSKNIYKSVYSNIDWNKFSRVTMHSVKNEKKYTECVFHFSSDITYTSFKNGEQFATGNLETFSCFIYKKDEEAFLKAVKYWEKSRSLK